MSRWPARGREGLTLLEVVIAVTVFTVVTVSLGRFFVGSSQALTSLTSRAYMASRAQVVLDRLVEEMLPGRFSSLEPAQPQESSWIRFTPQIGFAGGVPELGNPIQIEFVPLEANPEDGIDDDGNGLVDEGSIRIWEDLPPHAQIPGAEDDPVTIASHVAPGGLAFTRDGAIIVVDLSLLVVTEPGRPPVAIELSTSVKMRNGG